MQPQPQPPPANSGNNKVKLKSFLCPANSRQSQFNHSFNSMYSTDSSYSPSSSSSTSSSSSFTSKNIKRIMEQQQQQTTTSPILVDTSHGATAAVVNKSTAASPSIKNNYLTKKLFPEPVGSDGEEKELSNFSKSMSFTSRSSNGLKFAHQIRSRNTPPLSLLVNIFIWKDLFTYQTQFAIIIPLIIFYMISSIT